MVIFTSLFVVFGYLKASLTRPWQKKPQPVHHGMNTSPLHKNLFTGSRAHRAQELCIRFHNGMAVQVHGQTGSLMAIRQRVMARSDAFQLGDGLQAGHLWKLGRLRGYDFFILFPEILRHFSLETGG